MRDKRLVPNLINGEDKTVIVCAHETNKCCDRWGVIVGAWLENEDPLPDCEGAFKNKKFFFTEPITDEILQNCINYYFNHIKGYLNKDY